MNCTAKDYLGKHTQEATDGGDSLPSEEDVYSGTKDSDTFAEVVDTVS